MDPEAAAQRLQAEPQAPAQVKAIDRGAQGVRDHPRPSEEFFKFLQIESKRIK